MNAELGSSERSEFYRSNHELRTLAFYDIYFILLSFCYKQPPKTSPRTAQYGLQRTAPENACCIALAALTGLFAYHSRIWSLSECTIDLRFELLSFLALYAMSNGIEDVVGRRFRHEARL
jgi:hypothetical protein